MAAADDDDEDLHSEVFQAESKGDDIVSNLERLSFDFSVCNNFDDLPLYSDYFSNIRSISFHA